jgi:hypothetical protein
MEMGTVLLGFGKLKPVPVPVYTRGGKHTVLPVPVPCPICRWWSMSEGLQRFAKICEDLWRC